MALKLVTDKRGRIKGAARVDAFLRSLEGSIRRKIIHDVMDEIGSQAAEEIRAVTPVGPTGDLKRNLGYQVEEKTDDGTRIVVGPHEDQWYGIFPEFGTSHSSPNPYMRPTFDSRKRAWQVKARRRIADEVTREARKRGRL